MAEEEESSGSKSPSTKSTSISENSPLLPKNTTASKEKERKWPMSVVYRVLITAFLVSLSFGVTQVPLIYVFGIMTCDEYYKHHDIPPFGTPAYDERCRLPSIEASTARAVALLGGGTTFFGVANLFITGWTIKVWGIKKALLITIFWPAVRLLIQNVGVMVGAGTGILIIQLSQIITIVGGPAGYLLALNSFATEVVLPRERTPTIGRLTGCAMFGTALGYLAGGLMSDWYGMITPFRVTLVLFCVSTVYGTLFLPTVPLDEQTEKKASKSLSAFFDPLKMFIPAKWMLRNGTVQKEHGVLLLGAGAFLAVFATGYIPVLLQMYATDIFDFGTSENSELISLNFAVRATFLTFAFPMIIGHGRKWMKRRGKRQNKSYESNKLENGSGSEDVIPTDPDQLAATALPTGEANAAEPEEPLRRISTTQSVRAEREESFEFDLFYTRYSLILDGVLTSLATFTGQGWQMYVVAVVLPFAAGTGSAAKGTMLQMCTAEQRTDALSAISLLEMIARLSTVSLFGLVFAAFADVGRPSLTFAVNGAVALVGFIVLLFARFPPVGAVRCVEDGDEGSEDTGE